MLTSLRLLALIVILAALFSLPLQVQATTVSSTFTGAGVSSSLFVRHSLQVRVSLTNTWVGTVRLERSNNGQTWEFVGEYTANTAFDLPSSPFTDFSYRLNCTAYTSGTVTYSFADISPTASRAKFSTVPIGSVAYSSFGTSTTPVAGTLYYGDTVVEGDFTATGIGVLNAATVGTDKYIFALYNASGQLLGNTATAGTTTAGASAFQEIAFTGALNLTKGSYFIAVQLNGTTDRFRTVAVSTFVNLVGSSVTGTFATIPATITPPTSLTADKAPIAYIY